MTVRGWTGGALLDRDVLWVLGDWRLLPDASISGEFGNAMEAAMADLINP